MFNLREFLKTIENDPKHLKKVKKEVDKKYEATAILEKLQLEDQYPAVFYEKVNGYDIPVISNVFADRERIAKAFGVSGNELNKTIRELEAKPIEPQLVKDAPVQEVVWTGDQIDLGKLPIFIHNGDEAG